ncbi:MAG: hypothetical protein RLZZ584_723 [Pseudomonadota bacterium]|jgi:hypothetical protein
MRKSAPPVSIELRPNAAWRRATCLAPLLCTLVVTLWLLDHLAKRGPHSDVADSLPQIILTIACWLLAVVIWLRLRRAARAHPSRSAPHHVHDGVTDMTAATLRWDGTGWQIDPGQGQTPVDIELQVRIDLGRWLLLQAQPWPGANGMTARHSACWMALARHDHAAAWHGLRCALYSPRPPHAPVHDR